MRSVQALTLVGRNGENGPGLIGKSITRGTRRLSRKFVDERGGEEGGLRRGWKNKGGDIIVDVAHATANYSLRQSNKFHVNGILFGS